MTSAVTPADARALLEYVDLRDVRTYTLSGRRLRGSTPTDDVAPELGVRIDESELEVRMRLAVATSDAEFEVDIAVVYGLLRPVNLWSEVVAEFIQRVAVMSVYPFVREAVFSTASRMGVEAPVLGLVRQNDVSLQDSGGPALMPSRVPATVASLAREFGLRREDLLKALESVGVEVPSVRTKLSPEHTAKVRAALLMGQRNAATS
ncbi:hypothetical protein [Cellulomonas iranensis]|uniref:hypothetical protein n=1 Tax=Cellulomonas iranensis TaxID=76862 RepID=UPI003D7CCC68